MAIEVTTSESGHPSVASAPSDPRETALLDAPVKVSFWFSFSLAAPVKAWLATMSSRAMTRHRASFSAMPGAENDRAVFGSIPTTPTVRSPTSALPNHAAVIGTPSFDSPGTTASGTPSRRMKWVTRVVSGSTSPPEALCETTAAGI